MSECVCVYLYFGLCIYSRSAVKVMLALHLFVSKCGLDV